MAKNDIAYEVVTNKILELLDSGIVPWRKPWNTADGLAASIRGSEYRGVNAMILNCAPYASRYWITFNECKKRGGKVRKGEKGWPVVFWKFFERTETNDNGDVVYDKSGKPRIRSIPFLKYYTVFNVDQCEGLEVPEDKASITERVFNPIAACENVVDNMPNRPEIKTGKPVAFYSPAQDYVNMPEAGLFDGDAEYYSTLFHELAHSTGHKSRLNRAELLNPAAFGSHDYGVEELCAEFGAACLCGKCGVAPAVVENSAAYIGNWAKKIREDKKLIVVAAGRGQKAADYILGKKSEAK